MKFGRELKGAFFGAFLASTGCASEDAGSKDIKDLKEDSVKVEIYKGQEEVINSDEDVFVVPDEKNNDLKDLAEFGDVDSVDNDLSVKNPNLEKVKVKNCIEVEKKEKVVENYLMKEIEETLGDKSLSGFDVESEVKRIIPKLAKQYSDKMFGDQAVFFMKKHFKHLIENREYRNRVEENIKKYCERYDVPVSVAMGVIGVESGGNNNVVSNKQAYGIFQVKQVAADHLRKLKFNDEDWKGINIDDLEDNIRVGVAYLSYMYKRFGQYGLALAAYNTGPGNFEDSIVSRLNRYNYDKYSVEKRENKLTTSPQRINKEMIKKYPGGWPAFLRDNGINIISACSKDGLRMCERGYGGYPFHVMFLSNTVQDILESDDNSIELKSIIEKFK